MKYLTVVMLLFVSLYTNAGNSSENNSLSEEESTSINAETGSSKQMKTEAILTSRRWYCLDVSKKRLTKKLGFDMGNEINFSIDKKYSFKNNNYDYANGKWKLDGKFLYLFYNAPGTESRVETVKYKVLKLNDNSLILKRTSKPRGKITFK